MSDYDPRFFQVGGLDTLLNTLDRAQQSGVGMLQRQQQQAREDETTTRAEGRVDLQEGEDNILALVSDIDEATRYLDPTNPQHAQLIDDANRIRSEVTGLDLATTPGSEVRALALRYRGDPAITALLQASQQAQNQRADQVAATAHGYQMEIEELRASTQELLQSNELTFRTAEGIRVRAHEADQADLERALQYSMQLAEQRWRSGEANLDRILQEELQAAGFEWEGSQNNYDRILQAWATRIADDTNRLVITSEDNRDMVNDLREQAYNIATMNPEGDAYEAETEAFIASLDEYVQGGYMTNAQRQTLIIRARLTGSADAIRARAEASQAATRAGSLEWQDLIARGAAVTDLAARADAAAQSGNYAEVQSALRQAQGIVSRYETDPEGSGFTQADYEAALAVVRETGRLTNEAESAYGNRRETWRLAMDQLRDEVAAGSVDLAAKRTQSMEYLAGMFLSVEDFEEYANQSMSKDDWDMLGGRERAEPFLIAMIEADERERDYSTDQAAALDLRENVWIDNPQAWTEEFVAAHQKDAVYGDRVSEEYLRGMAARLLAQARGEEDARLLELGKLQQEVLTMAAQGRYYDGLAGQARATAAATGQPSLADIGDLLKASEITIDALAQVRDADCDEFGQNTQQCRVANARLDQAVNQNNALFGQLAEIAGLQEPIPRYSEYTEAIDQYLAEGHTYDEARLEFPVGYAHYPNYLDDMDPDVTTPEEQGEAAAAEAEAAARDREANPTWFDQFGAALAAPFTGDYRTPRERRVDAAGAPVGLGPSLEAIASGNAIFGDENYNRVLGYLSAQGVDTTDAVAVQAGIESLMRDAGLAPGGE